MSTPIAWCASRSPWTDARFLEGRELALGVRVSVPDDRVGRRRLLRAMMVGDNSDLRMETVGPGDTN